MDEITKWSIMIVIVSVCATILNSIAPNGNMQKAFNFILCAFVLYGIIYSFYNFSSVRLDLDNIDYGTELTKDFSEKILVQEEAVASQNVKALAEEILNSNDIYPSEIIVDLGRLEDESLFVKKITVLIEQKDIFNKNKIENKINEYLGIFPEVYSK